MVDLKKLAVIGTSDLREASRIRNERLDQDLAEEADLRQGDQRIDYAKGVSTMRLLDGRVMERFDTQSSSESSQIEGSKIYTI